VAQGPQCNDERKIPQAACDKAIPATECLTWHVKGRIPDAKLSKSGRVCSFRCPNHDDGKPSAAILVGDSVALNVTCHACGKDAKLEVRAAIIRVFGINPKCLPLSKQERVQQETMLEAVFTSPYTPCTRLVCVRAILDGMRGPLPEAPALLRLGERAGVSRSAVFRARQEAAGASLDHLFVPPASGVSQAPQVASAIRGSSSVPDRDSIPDWDRAQSQIGTDSPDRRPAA
jgi:hypothetical protein